jgi:hypothetical protein
MKRIALGFVALALILTACQSVSENIAESITEKALEGVEGVDGVNIDTDSGQVSIETEDGAITIGGGEMPDGFAIPAPDGYKVTSVFTSDGTSSVSLAYDEGDFAAIEAFYDDWTASQPSEWSKSSSSISGDNGTLDSANWSDDAGGAFISISNLCLVLDESIDPENCVGVNLNSSSG